MNAKLIGIFAVASVGALVLGCGDSSGTGGSGGSATTSTTSSTKAATTATGTASSSSGGNCADMCKTGANEAGYAKLSALVIKSCGCGMAPASPCATQCSADPACAATPGTPTGDCATCLDTESGKGSSSSCTTAAAFSAACMTDAQCSAVVQCELGCGA